MQGEKFMFKPMLMLTATLTLSGCAAVKLDASVPGQSDCPAVAVVSKASFLGLSAGDATQVISTPSMPFLSGPPTVEQLRAPRAQLQNATNAGQAQAAYDALLRLVPHSEDLVARQSSSLDAANAARDLHALLNELAPSINAGEQLRLTLATANAGSLTSRSTLATISTKEDINQRLSGILQRGGDDALVLYVTADLALKLSDFNGLNVSDRAERTTALQEAAANYQAARFLRTYFKAYFRGGKVFQSQLKVDEFTSKAMETIKGQVKLDPKDEAAIEAKLKDVLSKACRSNGDAGCLLTSLGKDKLVTRSGESLQFKGISLAIGYDTRLQATWDYPKSVEFAPQLVRVLIEAVFDSMKGRPAAVAASTACSVTPPLFGADECVAADGQGAKNGVQDVVAGVDEKASRADSLASVATGQIIRGVSVVALNNEALAKSAENFAGVLARKVVERAAWQQSGAGKCLTSSPALSLTVSKN